MKTIKASATASKISTNTRTGVRTSHITTLKSPATQIITDANGQQTGIIMDIKEYKKLLAHIEDIEDALALKEAKKAETSFSPAEEVFARIEKKKLSKK